MALNRIVRPNQIPTKQSRESVPETVALLQQIQVWERRLRITRTARWLPRGAGAGLIIGLLLALVARLSPWLLPNQLAMITVGLMLVGMVFTVVAVWAWPRSTLHSAQDFDRRFGLRERMSTALELSQANTLATEAFCALQRRNALDHARKIRARDWLPIQWQWRELAMTIGLIAVCLLAIGLANPQMAVVARNNAVNLAVAQAVQQIAQIKQAIAADPSLTDAQKAALTKIADDALKQLSQTNISQEQALAVLSQAAQAFANSGAQPTDVQRQTDQQAGQALTQGASNTAQGGVGTAQTGLQTLGGALQQGNLSQAANDAQALAQQIQAGQLNNAQAQNTANALDASAQALKNSDPALSQDLQNAANALRNSDTNGASQALNQAAGQLRTKQNNLAQAPVSQAAQKAAQQTAQDQQQVAQAGNTPTDQSPTGNNSNQPGLNSPDQSGSPNSVPNNPAGAQPGSQPSQNGLPNQSQSGAANNPQSGTGATSGGPQLAAGSQGSPNGTGGNQPGQNGNGSSQAAGQNANGSPAAGGSSANNGTGTSSGPVAPANTGGSSPGGGQDTGEQVYNPTFIGGSGGPQINLPSNPNNSNGAAQPGGFANPSTGAANVPLENVAGGAAAQADTAMNADQVPIGLRGVIHDYFSGLQSNNSSQAAASAPASP